MSVSCVFTCDHNGWSTPWRRFNKDTEKWCNLKKTLFFPRQTQEVQKAMDEKKFEEAVRLRGRYFSSATCWLLFLVETQVSFSSFLQEFWKQSDHLQTPVLPKNWLWTSKRKFPPAKPRQRPFQTRTFIRCVFLQQQHWGLRFSRYPLLLPAQVPREGCEHSYRTSKGVSWFVKDV